jgi:hypothetical protein
MSDFSNKLQLLKEIESLSISMDIKADVLRDIARTFPEARSENALIPSNPTPLIPKQPGPSST